MPSFRRVLFIAALCAASAAQAAPFSYTGRLEEFGVPANGRYDLRLVVREDGAPDHGAGLPVEFHAVEVVDGAFRLDFDLPVGSDEVDVALSVRPAGSSAWVAIQGRSKAISAPAAIGQCWSSTGDSGSDPAVNFIGTLDAQPFVVRTRNASSLRIEPSSVLSGGSPITANLVGGSSANVAGVGVRGATIAGGGAIPGGDLGFNAEAGNRVLGHYGAIGGGFANVVGGGLGNPNASTHATVAGGDGNTASADRATVGGGQLNAATGSAASVLGGERNTAAGNRSTVGGGSANCAGGSDSWAGGFRAKIRRGSGSGAAGEACVGVPPSGTSSGDEGTFMWADSESADFVSTGPDQFNVRARGGMGINTAPRDPNVELTVRGRAGDAFGGNADVQLIVDNANQEGIQFGASAGGSGSNDAAFEIAQSNATTYAPRLTLFGSGAVTIRSNTTAANTGVSMAANAGSWSSLSDRRLKTAIAPVDAAEVLARVLDLPLSTWSYIAQGEAIRHMGPMAQDFASAFGLGENDTTIATIDADGVALAAIQGLDAKLGAERDALRAENAALRERLARIERTLAGLAGLAGASADDAVADVAQPRSSE